MSKHDFTEYIPKNCDWINTIVSDEKSWEKFKKYLSRLYVKLSSMKDGDTINILDSTQVKEDNRKIFIQCVWYFIVYHDEFIGFEFNKTATILTKKKSRKETTKK